MSPHRRNEPGYFVVVDESGKEIAKSRRPVQAGFSRERDRQIVFALTMAKGENCEVVFRPQ